MVRGVHKRIIEVKISGSRLFDHACLVFKSGDIANETSERDILAEANRIISQNRSSSERRSVLFWRAVKQKAPAFLIGALCGALLALAILLL